MKYTADEVLDTIAALRLSVEYQCSAPDENGESGVWRVGTLSRGTISTGFTLRDALDRALDAIHDATATKIMEAIGDE